MSDDYTGTYSPEDNKLRLYAGGKLPEDVYTRVRAAGFKWAPKQGLFVAPMWTPSREDLLIELCGEIDDEDTSLVERQEQRAERFEDYSDNRAKDADRARAAVSAIADNIPFGQPILVGHHSEKHARRDAARIENGMRKAVQMWQQSEYWTQRAEGAIRHAKYKERPDVRARRIKGIEADKRKQERYVADFQRCLELWTKPNLTLDMAQAVAGRTEAGHLTCATTEHEGSTHRWSAYDVLRPDDERYTKLGCPSMTVDQVVEAARYAYPKSIARCQRWIEHYNNRLAYERAMLAESGGTVADQVKPEKGGGGRCWASPRGGWSYIQKVNKVSVTVLDSWHGDGKNFTRTIPFDKLAKLISARDVETAREDGRLVEIDARGFVLLDSAPEGKSREEFGAEPIKDEEASEFEKMAKTLKAGIQVITAPQLFPTPNELAEYMIDLADIQPGHRVLEPSAGTGVLLGAMGGRMFVEPSNVPYTERDQIIAVEINAKLSEHLETEFPLTDVRCGNFLECNGDLGKFDRIVMNPPFVNGADIKHIKHALSLLKPGGKLVALCANGSRQNEQLKPLANSLWEVQPEGSFKEQGTNVNVALMVAYAPADERLF